jgi:hypothetical protein
MTVEKKMPQKQEPSGNAKKESVERFVTYAATGVRLTQGLERLTVGRDGESVAMLLLGQKDTPRLCKWVMADVMKEEGDVIQEMSLTQKR